MSETLQKMISDGERIANLFEALTEGDKNIVLVYMSALRDKELADMDRAEKAGQEADIHMKKENNPKEQTTIRLTVRIPDELEKQVRDEAERRGLSINQMMIQMVTRYLKDHQD